MKKPFIILSQSRENCQTVRRSPQSQPQYEQLNLFDNGFPFKQKPQISSVKGSSPYQKNRYQVTLGDRVLGSRLNIDEAVELANQGGEA
jgi:hypothetical protein